MDWIKARLRRPKPTTTVRSSVQDAETRHENIQLPRSETHVREATLCEQCRTLLTSFEREKDYSWKTVHGTLASLMAAVQSHCHFCSEFWYRLTSAQRGSLPQHSPNDKPVVVGMVKKRTGALHDSDDDQYIVSLHASPSMPDRRHATQIFWLGSLQANEHCFLDYRLESTTSAKSCLDMARWWYEQCAASHTKCATARPEYYRGPSRVVDIKPTKNYDWRLHHVRPSEARRLQYLTLSHCWGKALILTLTSSSVKIMSNGMALSALPKTFRDAVQIARHLGFNYLWIDSLCIMQDSAEDWRKESAYMQEIYRFSSCTIAATAAAAGEVGCFSSRGGSLPEPLKLAVRWYDMADEREYLLLNKEYVARQLRRAPLNQRGWVVQERVLSPRTLHFGASQVFWECSESLTCETFPRQLPLNFLTGSNESLVRKCNSILLGVESTYEQTEVGRIEQLHSMWSALVGMYAGCALTRPEDKLVALSGLAKRFAEALPSDEYLAGLWKGNLPHNLMWSVVSPERRGGMLPVRPDRYRAPSWSWASVDAALSTSDVYFDKDIVLIDCLDVWTQTMSDDPTGQVTGGLLRIRCRLIYAAFNHNDPRTLYTGRRSFEATLKFDCPGEVDSEDTSTVILLPIRLSPAHDGESEGVKGLILRQQANRGEDGGVKYERDGYWTMFTWNRHEDMDGAHYVPPGEIGTLWEDSPLLTIDIV